VEEIFKSAPELKKMYNSRYEGIPPGAMGVYIYFQRLAQGMRQMMTGNRKFALQYIERADIAALTREAAEVSGIPHVMDVDKNEVESILNS
jgi:hypothetical protein